MHKSGSSLVRGSIPLIAMETDIFVDSRCPLSPNLALLPAQAFFARVTFKCDEVEPLSITFWTDPGPPNIHLQLDNHTLCGADWIEGWEDMLVDKMICELVKMLCKFNYRRAVWLSRRALQSQADFQNIQGDENFIIISDQVDALKHFWERLELGNQGACL